MNNIKPLMKRTCAYTIDMVIILTISSMITLLPFINKGMKNYQKLYKEYTEIYNEYTEYTKLLEETYKDNEINEEEYTSLIEKEQYSVIISSKYEDNTITKEEYDSIVSEIEKDSNKTASEYAYKLNKAAVSNSITTLVCTLLYFGVIQYFLKGQTIGKKIFKLKVVSASEKNINIFNYILRSLIINDVFLNTISIIFLLFATRNVYIQANNVISYLVSIAEAITIFLVLTREDERGLHDLLFNTKVISTDISKEIITIEKETIEATVEEKPKTRKRKTTKKHG